MANTENTATNPVRTICPLRLQQPPLRRITRLGLPHRTGSKNGHLVDVNLARDDVEFTFTRRRAKPDIRYARLLLLATQLELDLGELTVSVDLDFTLLEVP